MGMEARTVRDVRALKVARDIFLFWFSFLILLGVLGLVGFGWIGLGWVGWLDVMMSLSLVFVW